MSSWLIQMGAGLDSRSGGSQPFSVSLSVKWDK